MEFREWIDLQESSLNDLYRSVVRAFPETKKRQHAIDGISISGSEWVPFLGMKTLFVKGIAESDSGKTYSPIVVFKNVRFSPHPDAGLAEITASDGRRYFLERPNAETTDVLVRCNCMDFSWRLNYTDYLDRSLQGVKRKKYESKGGPPANPTEAPGLCKHLMALGRNLSNVNLLS